MVRLHMGPLIGPNTMPWYDFGHIKTLKFPPSPYQKFEPFWRKSFLYKVNWLTENLFQKFLLFTQTIPYIFRVFRHQNHPNGSILTMRKIRLKSARFSAHSLMFLRKMDFSCLWSSLSRVHLLDQWFLNFLAKVLF